MKGNDRHELQKWLERVTRLPSILHHGVVYLVNISVSQSKKVVLNVHTHSPILYEISHSHFQSSKIISMKTRSNKYTIPATISLFVMMIQNIKQS